MGSTICDFNKSLGSYRAYTKVQTISLLPVGWKTGFVTIRCSLSLGLPPEVKEETSRKRCNFPPQVNLQYLDVFFSNTNTLNGSHKLGKSQSSESTWHAAALSRAGLAARVQLRESRVGWTLAGPLKSQLQAGIVSAGSEQAPPMLTDYKTDLRKNIKVIIAVKQSS